MRRPLLLLVAALPGLGFNVVRDVGGDGPIVFLNPTVTLELHQAGSADVSDGSDLQALRYAMEAWNQVPCSAFRFVDGGTGTSRDIGEDGVNRIAFLESNWPGYASGAAAFTLRERVSDTPDRWTEFDILINGQDTGWATDGNPHRPDIQSTVVHELGHGLGLQHASHPAASMYFSVRLGTTFARTLHPDDAAGACYLYPASAFSCGSDADCPLLHGSYGGGNYRARCEQGACVPGPASTFGTGCFEPGHCASGICLIDPLNPPSSEPGFCTESCSEASCPEGSYCGSTANGPRCIVGREDCSVDADCGGPPNVCARQLDGRFVCQRLCLRNSACAVVPGAVCHGGTGENPAGFCRVPGPSSAGTPCQHGLECASLNCSAGGVQPTCADGVPGFDGDPPPPVDGSVPDAGSARDATVVDPRDLGGRDAGAGPRPDSSVARPSQDASGADAGPQDLVGGGCRCVRRSPASPSLLVLLLGAAWLGRARRQRGGAR